MLEKPYTFPLCFGKAKRDFAKASAMQAAIDCCGLDLVSHVPHLYSMRAFHTLSGEIDFLRCHVRVRFEAERITKRVKQRRKRITTHTSELAECSHPCQKTELFVTVIYFQNTVLEMSFLLVQLSLQQQNECSGCLTL